MKGQKKREKYVGRVTRKIVADQLRARLKTHFGVEKNQERKLAEAIGTTQSNIQRILAEDQGTSVDMLEQIAKFFHIAPYELLVPTPELRRMVEIRDQPEIHDGASVVLRQTDRAQEQVGPSGKGRRITK